MPFPVILTEVGIHLTGGNAYRRMGHVPVFTGMTRRSDERQEFCRLDMTRRTDGNKHPTSCEPDAGVTLGVVCAALIL